MLPSVAAVLTLVSCTGTGPVDENSLTLAAGFFLILFTNLSALFNPSAQYCVEIFCRF
jgi:hypothetical protein